MTNLYEYCDLLEEFILKTTHRKKEGRERSK
jgi:hypothetical protein